MEIDTFVKAMTIIDEGMKIFHHDGTVLIWISCLNCASSDWFIMHKGQTGWCEKARPLEAPLQGLDVD